MNTSDAASSQVEPDYDQVLRSNLQRVFNERDGAKRAVAIRELFTAEPVMYEPQNVVAGQAAISEVAGKLLEQFGPTFAFKAEATAVGHHGLACLRWRAGPEGAPPSVTGTDAAQFQDGKISRLWVLLDAARP